MEGLYAGLNPHRYSNLLGMIDAQDKRVSRKKMMNELALIRQTPGRVGWNGEPRTVLVKTHDS